MAIYFYRVNEPYGAFSNFAKYAFESEGQPWPTSEHYFQAQKFLEAAQREAIRTASSPREAARLGRDRSRPIRADWEETKVEIMRRAVRLKFSAHADLKRLLLATGEEEIIEKTTDDYFWGCGTDGSGLNMLGKILMEVREELRTGTISGTA